MQAEARVLHDSVAHQQRSGRLTCGLPGAGPRPLLGDEGRSGCRSANLPSWPRTTRAPRSWTSWWWQWLHSRQRLSRSVVPPSTQCTMWWGLAPVGRGAAADAALVTLGQDGPLAGAGVALAATQPQRLALPVEHRREDVGVTGQPDQLLRRQPSAVDESGVPQLAQQRVVVGNDQEVDALDLALGPGRGAAPGHQQFQGVGHALLRGGAVPGILGVPQAARHRRQRRLDATARHWIEPPEQLEHAVGLLLPAQLPLSPLPRSALLEIVAGTVVEMAPHRAAEQIRRLALCRRQQFRLVDRRSGRSLLGSLRDQLGMLRRDRPLRQRPRRSRQFGELTRLLHLPLGTTA